MFTLAFRRGSRTKSPTAYDEKIQLGECMKNQLIVVVLVAMMLVRGTLAQTNTCGASDEKAAGTNNSNCVTDKVLAEFASLKVDNAGVACKVTAFLQLSLADQLTTMLLVRNPVGTASNRIAIVELLSRTMKAFPEHNEAETQESYFCQCSLLGKLYALDPKEMMQVTRGKMKEANKSNRIVYAACLSVADPAYNAEVSEKADRRYRSYVIAMQLVEKEWTSKLGDTRGHALTN